MFCLCVRLIFSTVSLWRSGQEQVLTLSRSQYIKAKVNTSHHVKKAEEICEAVKKKRRALAAKEQQLEEGRQEVAELQRAWRRYEKQTQEGVARGRDISLDEDQVTMHESVCKHRS